MASAPERSASPEFSLGRPLPSAAAVIREIFTSPRRFFLNFSEEGPVREAVFFVALVSAVAAVLRLALTLLFGANDPTSALISAGQAVAFVVLSPAMAAVFAGMYLLSIRTFVGKAGTYAGTYRMFAYAYGAMVLYWIPVVNAFAFTYAALVLMTLGIRYVHRASLMTSLITALVAYVPAAVTFIFLQVYVTGFAFG
jgi:hypothetical protein